MNFKYYKIIDDELLNLINFNLILKQMHPLSPHPKQLLLAVSRTTPMVMETGTETTMAMPTTIAKTKKRMKRLKRKRSKMRRRNRRG